ncbi:hypothetical protein KCP77_06650 [Salmonella enterica subsp. enterica]|nr:hypothetical protein KCP77_06650 [Salmonella enterica subsp. enterica]
MRGAWLPARTINSTGWARIKPQAYTQTAISCGDGGARWRFAVPAIRWHCTVTFVIEWRITTMNAISAASSSLYAGQDSERPQQAFTTVLRRRY